MQSIKVGTISDFISKSLKITSSIFKGHVDEDAVGDLMYSAFTIGTSKAFQKRLKPLVKELFPNISKEVEDTVYDQLQKLMEDGRK